MDKIKLFITFWLILITTSTCSNRKSDEIYDLNLVDQVPEFIGGRDALINYISSNFQCKDSVNSKIMIELILDESGSIATADVLQGRTYQCDSEIEKILLNSPKWKPGMINNIPVKVRMILPIKTVSD